MANNAAPVFGSLTPIIPAGKDMQAALAFYEQKLGFTARYKAEDLSMAIMERSGVEIMLQNYDDPHVASQTSFRIGLSGVNALYSEYQAQGIPDFHLETDGPGLGALKDTPWGTREFAVRDLAGVCIAFYERRG